MNGGNYTCVVSNTAGNDSATAVLYVEPIIVTQPTDILTRNGTVCTSPVQLKVFQLLNTHGKNITRKVAVLIL